MISSAANERIKHAALLGKKASAREEEKLFIAEGARLFEETEDGLISELYLTEGGLSLLRERGSAARAEAMLASEKAFLVKDDVFAKMSDVVTPQGVLAVVKQREHSWEELIPPDRKPLIIMLEDLRDPGNLGTVMRSAEAAGATGVILGGDCADIHSPKVVRSTMGALFRLPFMKLRDLSFCFGTLRSKGVKIYAAAMEGAQCFSKADLTGGCAFIVGNEGKGLKPETIAAADGCLFIPMAGKTESLNASVSASLLLYEAARQRGYN